MKRLFFTSVLALSMNFLLAQDNGLEIILSRDSILAGNKVELIYRLINVKAKIKDIPELKNFMIISGPNHSSQMSIINGDVSSETALSFILVAEEEGVFEVPIPILDTNQEGLSFPKKYLTVLPNPDKIEMDTKQPVVPKKKKTKRKLYRI